MKTKSGLVPMVGGVKQNPMFLSMGVSFKDGGF